MSTANAAERLLAYQAGRPLPTFGAWPFLKGEKANRLVLAFVRMAGETGMWGFVVGKPGEKPRMATVPEPRNQNAAAELAIKLWSVLAPAMPHPVTFAEALDEQAWAEEAAELSANWQLCLPGRGHLDMLHALNYRWTFAKKGDPNHIRGLNAFGRACGFLFRESNRPGQLRVLDLTSRLREAWAFPAEGIRQAHLGFLLGMLEGKGDFTARLEAASAEETHSVGETLDPELEREELAPRLEAYGDVTTSASRKATLAAEIDVILRKELLRRFELCCRALKVIDTDSRPANPKLDTLHKDSQRAFVRDYFSQELRHLEYFRGEAEAPYVPSAETDNGATNGVGGLFSYQYCQDASAGALLHGDVQLAERAILGGDAVRGKLKNVAIPAGGDRPVWTLEVEGEGPLRLRVGSKVALFGLPNRNGEVTELTPGTSGRQMKVAITHGHRAMKGSGVPPADDKSLKGTEVILVAGDVSGITMRKMSRLRELKGPGTWLVGKRAPPKAALSADAPSKLLQIVKALEGK